MVIIFDKEIDNITLNDKNVFNYAAHSEYGCGASAVRMALLQVGIEMSEEDLLNQLNSTEDRGTEVDAIPQLFDKLGIAYTVMRYATIEDLVNLNDTGWTVIVRYYMPQYEADHYTVIQNVGKESIDLHDPAYGNNTMSLKNFWELWGTDKGLGNVPHWLCAIKNKPFVAGLEKEPKDNTGDNNKALAKAIEDIYKAQSNKVSREYDIPFIAGYSDNGAMIYIDKDVPETADIEGKTIDLIPLLVYHESVEKAIIDQLGIDYLGAHQTIQKAEKAYVEEVLGIDWKAYDKFYIELSKQIRNKSFTSIPADLDLTPYEQEAKIYPQDAEVLDRMKQVMEA